VRGRLQWDTTADVDALLDDFYQRWFGRAADPMKTITTLETPSRAPRRRPRSKC
jgi:hypothetical protein